MSAPVKKFMSVNSNDTPEFETQLSNEINFERNFIDYNDLALELDIKGSVGASKIKREVYLTGVEQNDTRFTEQRNHISEELRVGESKLVGDSRLEVLTAKDRVQDTLREKAHKKIDAIIAANDKKYKKSLKSLIVQAIEIFICNNENAINVEVNRFTSGGAFVSVNKRDKAIAKGIVEAYNEETKRLAEEYYHKIISKEKEENSRKNNNINELEGDENLFGDLEDVKRALKTTANKTDKFANLDCLELIDLDEKDLPDNEYGAILRSRDSKIVINNTFNKRIGLCLKAILPEIKKLLNLPNNLID